MNMVNTSIKADDGKLFRVLHYKSGTKIEIPINKDGSVKWHKDKVKQKNK